MPHTTVIIPNFNGAAYLGDAIASVLAQTDEDWTAVIGDNASSDSSVSVVGQFTDPRIRLVQRPKNIGWVANVNHLLGEAQTEFVAILHSDDWWEPRFLEAMTNALRNWPRQLVASCSCEHHGVVGARDPFLQCHTTQGTEGFISLQPADAARYLSTLCRFGTPSVLARRELYDRMPRFDETLPSINDWLMWLRAAAAVGVVLVPEVLAHYRHHPDSLTSRLRTELLWDLEYVRFARLI